MSRNCPSGGFGGGAGHAGQLNSGFGLSAPHAIGGAFGGLSPPAGSAMFGHPSGPSLASGVGVGAALPFGAGAGSGLSVPAIAGTGAGGFGSSTARLLLLLSLFSKQSKLSAQEKSALKDRVLRGDALTAAALEVFQVDQDLEELLDSLRRIAAL